jgi:hypothetical protein
VKCRQIKTLPKNVPFDTAVSGGYHALLASVVSKSRLKTT